MGKMRKKAHRPTDRERILYDDDGEIAEYDYLGSGEGDGTRRENGFVLGFRGECDVRSENSTVIGSGEGDGAENGKGAHPGFSEGAYKKKRSSAIFGAITHDPSEAEYNKGLENDTLRESAFCLDDSEYSESAKEFIREVLRLDRRHLFDVIALANRAARELHDAGIA